jgi:hypothetical protein
MVEARGRHNGLPHREPFMDCKHLSRPPTICSTTRAATASSLRSPSKPREELRLQGTYHTLKLLLHHPRSLVSCRLLIHFRDHYFVQAEGAEHSQGPRRVGGEAEGA